MGENPSGDTKDPRGEDRARGFEPKTAKEPGRTIGSPARLWGNHILPACRLVRIALATVEASAQVGEENFNHMNSIYEV